LDSSGQFFLAAQLDDGVLLGDLRIRVAGDLRRLDAAAGPRAASFFRGLRA
jgi:hypothetical protein